MKSLAKKLNKANKDNTAVLRLDEIDIELLHQLEEKVPLSEPVPANMLSKYPVTYWRMYLGKMGVYQVPTFELIQFLDHLIGSRTAIEICCGHGTIAKTLGIPATDRMLSNGTGNFAADTCLKMAENEWNRHPYDFPDFVENLTAHQAIEKYNPEVVIGCWVTEKNRGRKIGSGYGVEEDKILERVETYVHCGSSTNPLHTQKYIRKFKHWTIEADWLFDRGITKGVSQLKIWQQEEPDWDNFPENLEFDILT